MINIKQYNKDTDMELWNEFIGKSKNGFFMFERGFMDYHSDRFSDNSLLFYDDEELLAVLPLSKHDKKLCSHGGLTYGGFIVDENMKQATMLTCFEVLKSYMLDKDFKSLIYKVIPQIFHISPACEDIYALFKINAKIFKIEPSTVIDLSSPLKMAKLRKRQVAKAVKNNIIVEKSLDFDRFIELQNEVLSKHHNTKAVHTAEELKLLHSRFPQNIELWCAKYNGKIIAGTLLFISNQVVHTQYLAADEQAREFGGLDLVIKTLIDKYSNEKKYFDFGISSEDNGKLLNQGLIRQKEGFGGRTICYQTYVIDI